MSEPYHRAMLVNEDLLKQAESALGHFFINDRTLLLETLSVAGCGIDSIKGRATNKGNQCLAIYGDSVIETIMCDAWYRQPMHNKGGWDAIRTGVLGNTVLARLADKLGLTGLLIMNPNNRLPNVSDLLRATLMEACFGAIAMDGGLDPTRAAMEKAGLLPLRN